MVHYTPAAALFAVSSLVASARAGSIHAHHANLHNKKDLEHKESSSAPAACVYTTYTTTWYGEPGLMPETSTSSPTSTSTPWTTSTTSTSIWVAPTTSTSSSIPPPPPPPETTSTSIWVAPTTWEAPTTSAAPSSSESSDNGWGSLNLPALPIPSNLPGSKSSTGGDSSISPNGDKWAMTYTPYTSSGDCKSASDVSSDIASIKAKGFTTVRLYATDCSGIENVGSACKSTGLKMIMGIYIDASGLGNGYDQISELTSWGQSNGWDNVEMVVAGNEGIFNGYVSASEMAGFIGDAKSKFKAAGFTGPITTTEPLGTIQENADVICGAVDVIAANIHPFFNTDVSASGAGAFVSSQLELLADACGGSLTAYNLETGWPSAGNANGDAVPGTQEQREAVNSIMSSAGGKSAIFSFENDDWKSPGDLGVEQFWGCASVFPDM